MLNEKEISKVENEFIKSCSTLSNAGIGYIKKASLDKDFGDNIYYFQSKELGINFQIFQLGLKWSNDEINVEVNFEQILSLNSIPSLKEVVRLNKNINNFELIKISFNTTIGIVTIELPFVIYSTILGSLSYMIKKNNS